MTNKIVILTSVIALICLSACGKKTISGVYADTNQNDPSKAIENVSLRFEDRYDFRSDGTVIVGFTVEQVFHGKEISKGALNKTSTGTYTVAGQKVAVYVPGRDPISFALEGNGDLITGTGKRLKRE